MFKIDLHTHSVGSPDGGISISEYKKLLSSKKLDYIAITDHDSITEAVKANKLLGSQIIIGQEISTNQGEIIGLFLKSRVEPGLPALTTVKKIKAQGGIVYIPHPFETVRSGINESVIQEISKLVDIVEVFNGRALFQNKGPQASVWSRLNNKAVAASSDAHGIKGMATCFTKVQEIPTAKNLVHLLGHGKLQTKRPPLSSLLYPKYHRLRGKLKR